MVPAPPASAAAERADHQAAHRVGVAEAQLGLGRVHVDVQLLGRQVEPQRHHRMAPGGDHVAIGDAHRGLQHRVGDRAAVDRQRLRRGGGARDRRGGGEAGETQRAALASDRQQRRGGSGPSRAATRAGAVLAGRSNTVRPSLSSRNATPGAASANRRTAASACSASLRGCLRNLRRAGVAKNRSRTTTRVPGGPGGRRDRRHCAALDADRVGVRGAGAGGR